MAEGPVQYDFDAIVVGSGFGASVAAARLAEAGQHVCVLERGKAYPAGSFPRDPKGLSANLWDPTSGLHGLFDVWSFRGLESVVSSGLGGGSLIYANVLIRKDERWFVNEPLPGGGYERWPIDRATLDPHYDRVERALDAQRYPFSVAPYDRTAKTAAMREAANALGLEWQLPKLAVTFANQGRLPAPGEPIDEPAPNLHGSPRSTCRLCGECDVGCNFGAKNTMDYTYLSRAKDNHADIRTLSEVRVIDPVDGPGGGPNGYRVTYVRHDPDQPAWSVPTPLLPRTTLTSRRVIVAAGTFGTTYLLLKNRAGLPRMSAALGTRFSGNGDLLTFLTGARRRVDGSSVPRPLDPSVGPVITSAIRVGDAVDGNGETGRGFYVEDGGNPAFLDWLAEMGGAPSIAGRAAAFALRRVWAQVRGRPRSNVSADISRLMGGAPTSADSLPVLAMGRDIPDGVMRLRNGDLDVNWTTATSSDYFSRVEDTLRQIGGALGARVANTPLWLFKRVITVHPLGGAPMAHSDCDGVIGPDGQVFGYPGLFVTDGAAMPGPVGPNPSLTIAAFADHVADGILTGGQP